MAGTVTVRLAGQAWDTPSGALTLTFLGDKDITRQVVLPWIPDEIERSGFTRTWEQVPRPGLDPLAYDTGGQLRTFTFTVQINAPDYDQPVGHIVDQLEYAADGGVLVSASLGTRLLGACVITGLTIRESDWMVGAAPVDVTAEMELTEASDIPFAIGPVPSRRWSKAQRRPRGHTIKGKKGKGRS